jgi:hypothetical protein
MRADLNLPPVIIVTYLAMVSAEPKSVSRFLGKLDGMRQRIVG